MEPRLGRRRAVAPGADVGRKRRIEHRVVRPGRLREPREPGAVEPHPTEIVANRAALGAPEVDPPPRLVHAVEGPCLPFARSQALGERPVLLVAIQVLPPVTLAEPHEIAVLQP